MVQKKSKILSKNTILMLSISILFFLTVFLITVWNDYNYKNRIVKTHKINLLEKAEVTSKATEKLLNEYSDMLEHLQTSSEVMRLLKNNAPTDSSKIISRIHKSHQKGINAIEISSKNGKTLFSAKNADGGLNSDTSKKALTFIKKYNINYVSEVYLNEKNQQNISLFFPINSADTLAGILSYSVTLDFFLKTFSSPLHLQENIVVFVDAQGNYLKNLSNYEIDRSVVETFLADTAKYKTYDWSHYNSILDSAKTGKKGAEIVVFPENNKYLVAYQPINFKNKNFSILIFQDYSKTIQSTRDYATVLYLIVFAFIIYLLLISIPFIKLVKKNVKLQTEAEYNKEIIDKSEKIEEQKNKYEILSNEYSQQNQNLKKLRSRLIELNLQLGSDEKKYKKAQQLAKLGYWRINLISGKLELSEEANKIFGFDETCINPQIYFDLIEKNDKKDLLKTYQNALENQTEFNVDCSLTNNLGEQKHINIIGEHKYNKLGKPMLATGTIMDITEVKNFEIELNKQKKLFETMFNAISDGIIIANKDRQILLVNNGAENVFGYQKSELAGKSTEMLYANNIYYKKTGLDIFNNNAPFGGVYRTKFKHKNGQVFEGEILGAKLFDDKGNRIGNVGLIRNITERIKMINELKEAKEKAQESDRLKSAFLANMSHEIRTPMNGIIGFSDLLSEENLPKEKKEKYIKIIQNSGEQLLTIIDDIIDISKIEAGQIKIEKIDFDVNHVLYEIKSIAERQIEQTGKNIELKFTGDKIDKIIFSDPMRLRQILQNLINNSIKFTQSGYIEINLTEKSAEVLQIFVKDTGIGILPENHDLIFYQFRQAEEGLARKYGGTGLGLAISKALVELLGGKIWLNSEKNKGTTFFFTIKTV